MTFNNKYCAPPRKNEKYTCFTESSLKKIGNKWNNENPKDYINIKLNKKDLWKSIKSKLLTNPKCQEDYCLLKNHLVKSIEDGQIIYETFIPSMPSDWNNNHKAWLSTLDIQRVLLQYEAIDPHFEFIGPTPIDYDAKIGGICVTEELCKFDLEKYYREKKYKIGIVFNLDKHDQGGSHWVSLFIDIMKGGVYFFDSVGKKPKKEISKLMDTIKTQGNKLLQKNIINTDKFDRKYMLTFSNVNKINDRTLEINTELDDNLEGSILEFFCDKLDKTHNSIIEKIEGNNIILKKGVKNNCKEIGIFGFKMFYNDFQHQFLDTECGVYSIYFISSILNGISFESLSKNKIDDDSMNKKRSEYFKPSS